MHLGMGLHMAQRMILECTACGQPMDEHAKDCPQGEVERTWNAVRRGRCPACRKDEVFPNEADFFECRTCHTQFSLGLVCGGEDPDTLETKILDLSGFPDLVQAKQMKTPGTGDIPVLKKMAILHARVRATRISRRWGQRAEKQMYDRVMKRELERIEKKNGGTR